MSTRLITVLATIGLVLAIAGTVIAWLLADAAIDTVEESLEVSQDVIVAVNDSIEVLSAAIDSSTGSLQELVVLSQEVQEAITTTGSVLSGADQVLGETVPAGIDAIRQPLSSVAESLTQVEAVLAGLTLLGVDFAPDTALGTSLGRIDQELAALSAQLQDPELRLGRLEQDFAAITTQLGEVEDRIAALALTAEESQAILAAYESTAQQAEAIVEESIEDLDLRRTLAQAFVVIVGLTLALAHVALLVVSRRLRGE